MNNKVNCIVMFLAGLGAGLAGGYYYAKKKYEIIANEEIESAKEAFNKAEEDKDNLVEQVTQEFNENLNNKIESLSETAAEEMSADKGQSPMDYMNKFKGTGDALIEKSAASNEQIDNIFEKYASRETTNKKPGLQQVTPTPYVGNDPIYVINPEEYGNLDDYNLVSLTLTKDGYLLDDENEIIDDPAGAIGDALIHMGEYEDDAVHVRNDIRQCDYEVLQDLRPLNEIIGG